MQNSKILSNVELLILVDYRSQFFSSTLKRGTALNVQKIVDSFVQEGLQVSVKNFSEIDFNHKVYTNTYVLYQSSEDPSLKYKDYIEDILLGLMMRGAILIPDFLKFRAHHNKVFMEILREDIFKESISTRFFGTYEEYKNQCRIKNFPVVLKSASGSRSKNVRIAYNQKDMDKRVKELSYTPSLFNLKLAFKNLFDKKGFTPISNFRSKFIIQDYIKNMLGDYKIVIYAQKYFVFYRPNRPNDFRASGTLDFFFVETIDSQILNYAEKVFNAFDVPFGSFDIGFDGENCHLFEFQFVQFGQRAVELSDGYFERSKNTWVFVRKYSKPEEEIFLSVCSYIKRKKGDSNVY